MEYFISGFWIAFECIAILLFFSSFLERRKERRVWFAGFFAWLVIFLTINLNLTQGISSYIRYAIIFAFALYMYEGRWYVHLLLEVFGILLILAIDAIVGYGACAIMGIPLSELIWMKFAYATVGTICNLMVLFLFWLIYRLRTSTGLRGIQGKWFLLTVLFPAVSILVIALNYTNNRGSNDVSIGVFFISLVLAAANIGIIYLIHTLEKATVQEQEMALLKQQMDFQQENYAALENSYSTQKKASHEFERHIQTICDLLDKKEYDTAHEYSRRLKMNRAHRIVSIYSNHPVIDVILSQKYQLATDRDISMQLQINDLSGVHIQTDHLVVLLSNLLDNAIEACEKVEGHREIYCSMLLNDSLYISVRNTSVPVIIKDNEITNDKNQSIDHGYGIPAIKYVLDHLNAEYTFGFSQGWFQFVIDIPCT